MKKLNTLMLALLVWGGVSQYLLAQEIVVRQDKQGNLIISNEAPYSPGKKGSKAYRRAGGLTYVPSSPSSFKVPAKYLGKIRELAQKYGLKESLITAVARAESGFNPFAVSRKGAVGIMQLMKDTAIKYGVINRYNPYQNLEGGVKHLKYLYERYRGNLRLILAAYNAGEEAVKKYNGVPPYNETQTFIKRVMKYMGMGYSSFYDSKFGNKIYQYRTKEGKIVITDTYPSKAPGPVTIID